MLMKRSSLAVFAAALSFGCSADSVDAEAGGAPQGGALSSGGAVSGASGAGVPGKGGSGNVGSGAGGTSGSGGSSTVGGNAGAGGGPGPNPGAGGAVGSGGVSSNGGATQAGGSAGASGKGGEPAAGGSAGTGGNVGAGGTVGTGGSSGTCTPWPTAKGSQSVSATIKVSSSYDGGLKRFVGSGPLGTSGQSEGQDPIFELSSGATLRNVIIGAPAADGIHCEGACTLENVWWEDVGEDAATFRGSSSSIKSYVRCGGARNADDKVFQHNGAGTLTISDFTVETFGKLYRSCGNCSTQYARHVVLQDIVARSGKVLAGINTNYGDTADFDRVTVYGSMTICQRFTGNDTGAEPTSTGTGPDSQYCRYTSSDVTQK
jgi:hypothetical protein